MSKSLIAAVCAACTALAVPVMAQNASPAADTTPTSTNGAGTLGAGLGGAGTGGTGSAEPGTIPTTGLRPVNKQAETPAKPTDPTSAAIGTSIGTAK